MICGIVHLPWQYGNMEPAYVTNRYWGMQDEPPWVSSGSIGRELHFPNTGMLKFKILEVVNDELIEHLLVTPSEQIQQFKIDKPLICQSITMLPITRKRVPMSTELVSCYNSRMVAYVNSIELLLQSQMIRPYVSPTSLAHFLAEAKHQNIPCVVTENTHISTLDAFAEVGMTPLSSDVSHMLATIKSTSDQATPLEVLIHSINDSQHLPNNILVSWLGADVITTALDTQAVNTFVVQSETLAHHLHPSYVSWVTGIELAVSDYQIMTPTVEAIQLGETHCSYSMGFGLCLDELLTSQYEYIDMTFYADHINEIKVKQSILDQHSPAVSLCEANEFCILNNEQSLELTASRIVMVVNNIFGRITDGRVVKTPLEEVYMYFNIQDQHTPFCLYFDLVLHAIACGAIPNKTDFRTAPQVEIV